MYNGPYYPFNYQRKTNIFPSVKHMNWSNILDGTQKTLSIINQAIPVFYQIKPLYQNAKTAFKVVNAFKKETNIEPTKKENIVKSYSNNPTYFL